MTGLVVVGCFVFFSILADIVVEFGCEDDEP